MADMARPRTRTLEGLVATSAMEKSIVVSVKRKIRHPRYNKYVMVTRRFLAHDEENTAAVGDRVIIAESRPISRSKRWRLRSIIETAVQDSPDVAKIAAIEEASDAE
jgi:small subunit ribosomal protein S17